jgi:hypothetical protein
MRPNPRFPDAVRGLCTVDPTYMTTAEVSAALASDYHGKEVRCSGGVLIAARLCTRVDPTYIRGAT